MQGAPAEQGLEGGQEGQLHQVSLYTDRAMLMSLFIIGIVLRLVIFL